MPQADMTQAWALLAMAAFCELLHWQALSLGAQPTADAAEAMQEVPQVGTAAIAEAQGFGPAEHAGGAEVIGPLGVGALEAGAEEPGVGDPPVGLAEHGVVGLALTHEQTAAAEPWIAKALLIPQAEMTQFCA